jgi:predicted nucleic-acid-binding protein
MKETKENEINEIVEDFLPDQENPVDQDTPKLQEGETPDTPRRIRPYAVPRDLVEDEVDAVFALYDKYNGNINQMILDKDSLFKSYGQNHYYVHKYNFKERLAKTRRERIERVADSLQDAKAMAVENAIRILKARNVFVYNKFGGQVFDKDGNPLIVENLPYYKEIKTAWEIIKTELGEATSIGKNDITSGGQPLANEIVVTFKDFSESGDDTDE